eukprot:m51a1_g8914 hypothetical protein (423) ;mRNA; r:785267-786719
MLSRFWHVDARARQPSRPAARRASTSGAGGARDPYDVLRVPRDATAPQIKKAYYDIAKTSHPDMNPGDAAASERFAEAMRAYQLLADPLRRSAYDQGLCDAPAAAGAPDSAPEDGGVDALALFELMMRDATGSPYGGPALADALLARAGRPSSTSSTSSTSTSTGDAAGGAGGPREPSQQQKRVAVDVSLAEAARGATRAVAARVRVRCEACAGAGAVGEPARCAACAGTGQTAQRSGSAQPLFVSRTACAGEGSVEADAELEVRVPAGVRDGQVVEARLREPRGAVLAGPVYAGVSVAEHALYRREGDDLHVTVPVTVDEVFQGAEKRFPGLLGGVESVRLERGQPWETCVVNYGKGLTDKGNLVVHFSFTSPCAPPLYRSRTLTSKGDGDDNNDNNNRGAPEQQDPTAEAESDGDNTKAT